GVALAQSGAIDVEAEAHHVERTGFLAAEPPVRGRRRFAPRPAPDLLGARADRVERVVESGPARHPAGPGSGAEGRRLGAPAGRRRLRGVDLVGAHAFEPVVARVELAHVVEAEPAPVSRAVEAGSARARSAELARLVAARRLALP